MPQKLKSQIRRLAAALWAASIAVWMPGLFDGYGAPVVCAGMGR